jgi:hypothetical protein
MAFTKALLCLLAAFASFASAEPAEKTARIAFGATCADCATPHSLVLLQHSAAKQALPSTSATQPWPSEPPAPLPTLAPTPSPTATEVTLDFLIENIDFSALTEDNKVDMRDAIAEGVASEAGAGITAADVDVKLSSGSVVVNVTITLPQSFTRAVVDLVADLANSTSLTSAVVTRLQNVSDIGTTGSISIGEITVLTQVILPPVAPSASGDPHLINTLGHKFDIVRTGLWEMLRLPREATATDAKVSIHAQIVDTSGSIDGCAAAPYIAEVHFNGSWLEQSTVKVSLRRGDIVVLVNGEPHRASSQSVMLSDKVQMRHSEHRVEVQIGEASVQVARDSQMVHFFLNLQAWVGSCAIARCTSGFWSGRSIIIKMWAMLVDLWGRCWSFFCRRRPRLSGTSKTRYICTSRCRNDHQGKSPVENMYMLAKCI